MLINLPLAAARNIWDKYVVCPKRSRIVFDRALEAFDTVVDLLFGRFVAQPSISGGGSGGYGIAGMPTLIKPSGEFRRKIFDAGRYRKLLRITYSGIQRVVEPYSLVFKEKKDGEINEYLYVWDRSGGNSKPGIKSFIFQKIQSIEPTEEEFDPRFEIELVKSDQTSETGYFSEAFSSRSEKSLTRVKNRPALIVSKKSPKSYFRAPEMVYIIQCSVCGKKFRRSTYTTSLNNHKDKLGNQCFGGFGVFLEQK